jgi:hypothetical protein
MTLQDEYRAKAAECRTNAETAQNEWDRSQWLELAELWLRLVRDGGNARRESFDSEHPARATGQPRSKSSH